MSRILNEPLVHFFIIGATIFAAFTVLGEDPPPQREEIVVSAGKVENLAALFARTWQRPPTADELKALVSEFVREEILYREGVAMGLDDDDTVIRRRIRQKVDFMIEDMMSVEDPGDEVLSRFLESSAERYRLPAIVRFRQVYLDPARRGGNVEEEARRLLAALENDSADFHALGDRIMLEPVYADISVREVKRLFGEVFAKSIATQPVGEWTGPVPSAFGLHLVRVDHRRDARMPTLDEVRAAVLRDWSEGRRDAAREAFYRQLLERYEVTIETREGIGDVDLTAAEGD